MFGFYFLYFLGAASNIFMVQENLGARFGSEKAKTFMRESTFNSIFLPFSHSTLRDRSTELSKIFPLRAEIPPKHS
jgi:hypothetical protein